MKMYQGFHYLCGLLLTYTNTLQRGQGLALDCALQRILC